MRTSKKRTILALHKASTPLPLGDWETKLKDLARKHGKTYYSISENIYTHFDHEEPWNQRRVEYRFYIDGFGSEDGDTPDEAFQKLKGRMGTPTPEVTQVIFPIDDDLPF